MYAYMYYTWNFYSTDAYIYAVNYRTNAILEMEQLQE